MQVPDDWAEYLPTTHDVHAVDASTENVPAGHGTQSPDDEDPTVPEYFPLGHEVQSADPEDVEYFPASQSTQADAEAPEYLPAGH